MLETFLLRTAGGTEFNQAGLEAYFPESKELGAKLYKFMKHHSKFPRDKSQGIDFDTYLSIGTLQYHKTNMPYY